jgi:hypothetical protein
MHENKTLNVHIYGFKSFLGAHISSVKDTAQIVFLKITMIPATKKSRNSLKRQIVSSTLLGMLLINSLVCSADEEIALEPVIVVAFRTSELGIADSANSGVVTQKQLAARTIYRPGELLEATPGLIVSQHSGEGKANQYYLRGFNLDHGTDLRTTVDGMVVNQRSHGHGQGWTDVNFIIPEISNQLEYKKGPFYASEGDFSSAGAVSVVYANKLDKGIASIGMGQNGYLKTLLADSPTFADGRLLYAIELFHNDGPFTRPDDYQKLNGVLRYSEGNVANGFNITAMAYKGKWNATDQIPKRAVQNGSISRFDAIDLTDGGQSRRQSLSGEWRKTSGNESTKINAYVISNMLDLYSNFTYFLDDPVNGDQFNQADKRMTNGLNISHFWQTPLLNHESINTVGLQLQNDNIFNGLHSTVARRWLSTTREDHIVENSAGIYFENATKWSNKFRTLIGIRHDFYRFDVNSNNVANSGRGNDALTSPKLALIFGPWAKTEYYLNVGSGFHSNDVRGATISVDPKTSNPVDKVPALVRSKGLELGVRTEIIPRLQSALSVYGLDIASELIFVGDAGTTQAARPSRRYGSEFSNFYRANDWLTINANIAFARARFRDTDPAGNRILGAIEGVGSLALAIDNIGPYFGALQLRYFGPRPLIENNSIRSQSTSTLNSTGGYKITPTIRIQLEGFNLTNRKDSAIDYYYESRLKSEPNGAAISDVHFHPTESRSLRVRLTATF